MRRFISILLFLFTVALTASTALAEEFVVIVNKSNPVGRLSNQDAKRIFLGKRRTWPNRTTITVITQEGTAVHKAFLRTVIGNTPKQYSTYWKQAIFTGTGTAPKSFKTDAEVKAFVSSNVNAIGYIGWRSPVSSVKKVTLH